MTRYADAWNAHDALAVAACFSEDGSLSINGGEPAVGSTAIRAVMQVVFDAHPDAVFTVEAVRVAGDRGVQLWTFEGTSDGSGGTPGRVVVSGWDEWTLSSDGHVQRSVGNFPRG